jgi:hypothetical protein
MSLSDEFLYRPKKRKKPGSQAEGQPSRVAQGNYRGRNGGDAIYFGYSFKDIRLEVLVAIIKQFTSSVVGSHSQSKLE